MPWSFKWSTTLVLVIQIIAVGVGTIAPACRWFIAINYCLGNYPSPIINGSSEWIIPIRLSRLGF
jgi:hypothetical protein